MLETFLRKEVREMRTQSGPMTCLECNLVLGKPRISCPRCEHPYRVGRCDICHAEATIVNGSTFPLDRDCTACVECSWAGEQEFRNAAAWSAPLGFVSFVGLGLVFLCILRWTIIFPGLSLLQSWPAALRYLVMAVGFCVVFWFAMVAWPVLKRFGGIPDFPTMDGQHRLGWILRAKSSIGEQSTVEDPIEQLADVRKRGDALKFVIWTVWDLALLFLLFISPKVGRVDGWWNLLVKVLASLLILKYLARTVSTFLKRTTKYRARFATTVLDEFLPGGLFILIYVPALGAVGIFAEWLTKKWKAARN